jgi:flagellar protein FliO/FliZ
MPKSLLAASAAAFLLLLDVADALGADKPTGEKTPVNLDLDEKSGSEVPGASAGGSLVRTIVGLAIVIGVIYGLYWVLKQVKASREERASGQGLAPIATLPLGPNRSLHLVRAGGEVVLLGVGEGGVTTIRTYGEHEARALGLVTDDDDPQDPPAGVTLPGVPAARPSFGQALRRSLDLLRAKTVIR